LVSTPQQRPDAGKHFFDFKRLFVGNHQHPALKPPPYSEFAVNINIGTSAALILAVWQTVNPSTLGSIEA